jgi:hypothetical protein
MARSRPSSEARQRREVQKRRSVRELENRTRMVARATGFRTELKRRVRDFSAGPVSHRATASDVREDEDYRALVRSLAHVARLRGEDGG